jgi:hypothetical protein
LTAAIEDGWTGVDVRRLAEKSASSFRPLIPFHRPGKRALAPDLVVKGEAANRVMELLEYGDRGPG